MAVNIGITVWGVAGAPATNNTAGMEALTFVQLKGIEVGPVFGVDHAGQDVVDLATGFTTTEKAQASGKDTSFMYHGTGADTGIATAIVAANARPGTYTLKIARGSGAMGVDGPALVAGDAVQYAQGYLHDLVDNPSSVDSHEGATIAFKQNAATVVDVEPS